MIEKLKKINISSTATIEILLAEPNQKDFNILYEYTKQCNKPLQRTKGKNK